MKPMKEALEHRTNYLIGSLSGIPKLALRKVLLATLAELDGLEYKRLLALVAAKRKETT